MRIAFVPVAVVLSAWLSAAEAIRCYQCDQFPEAAATRPCPGPRVIDFGSKFDACIVYRLESGQIVFQQEAHTSSGLCKESSSFLAQVIRDSFGADGVAMCCTADGCNKDVPEDLKPTASPFMEKWTASSASSSAAISTFSITLAVCLAKLIGNST